MAYRCCFGLKVVLEVDQQLVLLKVNGTWRLSSDNKRDGDNNLSDNNWRMTERDKTMGDGEMWSGMGRDGEQLTLLMVAETRWKLKLCHN